MKIAVDPRTGVHYWVDADNRVVGVANASPGIGARREADMMARLPDAELAGFRGPGVVPPKYNHAGARPGEPGPSSSTNKIPRLFEDAPQNNRGATRIIPVTLTALTAGQGGPFTETLKIASIVDSPRGERMAEAISCSLALIEPTGEPITLPQTSEPISIETVCNLEWGTGGAIFSAETDWSRGTSFGLLADYVRISATINISVPVAVIPSTAETFNIVLGAGIGYGNQFSAVGSSPARRTKTVEIAAAATESIEVPAWALGFSVLTSDTNLAAPTAPNLAIEVRGVGGSSNNSVFQVTSRTNLGNQRESQFPLPLGAHTLNIRNNGASSVLAAVVFNLGF